MTDVAKKRHLISFYMKGEHMNDGVRILLERIKTNPEEFYSNVNGKWSQIINGYIMHLNKEDRDILNDAIDKLMQQRFTEEVLGELVDPTEETNVKKLGNMFTQRKRALAAQTPIQYTANELTRTHIEAHEKALGQTPIAGVTQTL